jgi:hypothetical protein
LNQQRKTKNEIVAITGLSGSQVDLILKKLRFSSENFSRRARVLATALRRRHSQPPRQFETWFRGMVKFQPSPKLFRLSPNAGVEILNRKCK